MSNCIRYTDDFERNCVTDKVGNLIDWSNVCTCVWESDWLYLISCYDYLGVCKKCSKKCEKKEEMDKVKDRILSNMDTNEEFVACKKCDGCKNLIKHNRFIVSFCNEKSFISDNIAKCGKCNHFFQGDKLTFLQDTCLRCKIEKSSALLIQRRWRKCRYDPKYKMCEKVQTRNLELIVEDN